MPGGRAVKLHRIIVIRIIVWGQGGTGEKCVVRPCARLCNYKFHVVRIRGRLPAVIRANSRWNATSIRRRSSGVPDSSAR